MLKLIFLNNIYIIKTPFKIYFSNLNVWYIFFLMRLCSENYVPKNNINGSGLKIPRIVSLKNSLTYMRSGPGKKYPVTLK